MIPIVRPTLYDFDEVVAEFRQAWESGQVTTNVFARQFETAVEEKLQVQHAIMVQSCTAGLMLVLRALDIRGEVIIPAFTWTATAHALIWNNLTPVFVDINPSFYTLDVNAAARAVTSRTGAIMPVNVFGCPPDYDSFAKLSQATGITLLYDSAQGLGSRVKGQDSSWRYSGIFGEAEVFSLSPTKVISAIEGGLITTNNTELAQKLRQMRDYGKSADGEDINWMGLSARVSELNSIVARHNFVHLDDLVAKRQELIASYKEALGEITGVTYQEIPPCYYTSGNYLTLFIDNQQARCSRDESYEQLKTNGIQAKKYFYPALHLQEVYRELGSPYVGKLPVTEKAAAQGLALPLYSHMEPEIIHRVAEAVRQIMQ
jgi:dTDP-4-amino-4,6-dideoxygalactose transaminase